MAPQTEFQKLVGLIRTRDELATLRRVPLDGLRDAVNGMIGARVPAGDIEGVAHDLRRALEDWLPSPAAPAAAALAPPPERAAAPALPRVGFVAAACEHPSVQSAARASERGAGRGWRWLLLLSWAVLALGCVVALEAVAWSPAGALAGVAAALSDLAFRALTGDPLSLGALLSAAGLSGIALANFWLLVHPGAAARG
ncbi:MAG TPA: hypothetical protein VMV26_15400 [Alphaproteobacteria bacterium]|jgi:hypothetical protein|nr:hypothetical protein [Alphaproteobacteria bacterium]